MITDFETTSLYVADTLKTKYSEFFHALETELDALQITPNLIPGTKDIWCRDYMPVQVAKNDYLSFVYDPDYLRTKSGSKTISDVADICRNMILAPRKSDLVIDGGNIVRHKNKVILTDKIFRENRSYEKNDLIDKLYELLKVEQVIIIPADRQDFTGHADGMVRFIDDTVVLLNDYSRDKAFNQSIVRELKNADLDIAIVPYNPYLNKNNTQAQGIYINYLQMKQGIIVPIYGRRQDDQAVEVISKAFSGTSVTAVDCNSIANQGGVLNCITWNILR